MTGAVWDYLISLTVLTRVGQDYECLIKGLNLFAQVRRGEGTVAINCRDK